MAAKQANLLLMNPSRQRQDTLVVANLIEDTLEVANFNAGYTGSNQLN